MHYIQRKILSKLLFAPTLGYAQMRPEGVESNHFSYHLEQLIRAGLVAKEDHKYHLTTKGLALADRVNHEQVTERTQPQIITSTQILNNKGQTLLFKHAFQPYLNLYGFPQGRLHNHENVLQAAEREVHEKTGLGNVPLTHRGIVYVTATQGVAVVSKQLMHVFSGRVADVPMLQPATHNGESLWIKSSDVPAAQCMPGLRAIEKLLGKQNNLFFAEITEELNSSPE